MGMSGPPDGRHLSKAEEEAEVVYWPGRKGLPEGFAKTDREAEDDAQAELGRCVENGVRTRLDDERFA